ncbi:C-type lectin 37Db-like [Musca autumnalis]|uniref:C-type lectin 37Db-like n=1 Tax=Musca autumnalis TaxID=221902 RepID=UPI003CE8AA92
MSCNRTLMFCLLCFMACHFGTGSRTPNVTATVLENYPDNLEVSPFTRLGQKLYHIGESKVNWFKANLICRGMGGYLASFDNQQEFNELSEHLKTNYPTDRWFWISGSDLHSEGQFYYYRTGEPMKYAAWTSAQPDNGSNKGEGEDCVHLWYKNSTYEMNDWICSQDAFYICEADKPTTILVTVF